MGKLTILLACTLMATALAGCGDESPKDPLDGVELGNVDATSTTGGIRGVVVDQAIRPIGDAEIRVLSTDLKTKSAADGTFVLSGIKAGTVFVVASHPTHDEVQQSVEVVAGVADPKAIKFQLTRLIDAEPYMTTIKEQGFIVCSANLVGLKSEECGEGVGVDGQGRVGKNPNNRAQIDFTVDGPHLATLIVEQVWEPSTEVGGGEAAGQFDTVVALAWSCLPECKGDTLGSAAMASPLLIRIDRPVLESREFASDTVFSTFTWAEDNPGILLEQEFEEFISMFYYLEAPADWSFAGGSVDPYA